MRLIALIIILILLAAIMLIPLGINASYTQSGFSASASVWRFKIGLYPAKPKKPAPEVEEATEADEDKPHNRKPAFLSDFTLNDWIELAKIALRALSRFKRGVYFDFIRLYAVISANDPYDAVIVYNTVNGFVGSAIPFFESEFRVKKKDIYIGLDLNSGKNKAEFEVSASIRVGSILAAALAAGAGFAKILIRNRIRRIRERVARNGEQQIERNDAVNDEQHQGSC